MKKESLKPCPVPGCNSEKIYFSEDFDFNQLVITCYQCGYQFRSFNCERERHFIDRWNTRHIGAPETKKLRVIVEAAEDILNQKFLKIVMATGGNIEWKEENWKKLNHLRNLIKEYRKHA